MAPHIRSRTLAFAMLGIVVSGCSLIPAKETGGVLHVGRPQVFSRERLLNERLGEVNWLREQLNKEIEPGFHGIQDARSAHALLVQVGIQLNVLQGRQKTEISQAQHENELQRLRNRQQDLINRVPEAEKETAEHALQQDIKKLQDDVKALASKIDALSKPAAPSGPGRASGLLDPQTSRTLDPKQAQKTDAVPMSLDRFEDQAAYRDFVNARIREKNLDDSHDLSGATLYELKFDVTFAPGTNTRRFLLARLTMADPFGGSVEFVDDPFLRRVRTVLYEEMNEFSKRLQDRALRGALSESWIRRLLTTIGREQSGGVEKLCGTGAGNRIYELLHRSPMNEPILRPQRGIAGPAQERMAAAKPDDPKLLACAAALFVRNRFQEPYQEFFTLTVAPVVLDSDSRGDFYRIGVTDKTGVLAAMKNRIGEIQKANPIRVATIEPKEYAQNISDVGSRNEATQIGLSLGLLSAKGLDLQSTMERFSQDQRMLQAIKRQPLAVSFLDGQAGFGWLLGPRFAIDSKQNAVFVHSPARYVFTASVTVPGWMRSLNLTGEACWISAKGKTTDCFPLFEKDLARTVNVNLPGQYHRAFVPALLRHGQELLREPEIFLLPQQYLGTTLAVRAASDQCLGAPSLRSCEQQVVIEGRELWRNPEVYIGNQKADNVALLPNMRGVVATFRALKSSPARPDKQRVPEDLLVVTSIGSDRLRGAVTVLPDVPTAPKAFVRPRTAYIDKVGEKAVIEFGFDPAALPATYYSILGRIRPLGTREWKDLGTPARPSPGVARFEIDPSLGGLTNKTMQVEVDFGMRFNPEDEFHSVLDAGLRNLTYFPNVADRSVTARSKAPLNFATAGSLGTKELAQLRDRLTFQFATDEKMFLEAYPGLVSALDGSGGNARLFVTSDSGTPVAVELQRTAIGKATAAAPSAAGMREAAKLVPQEEKAATYSVAMQYRLGNGEWQPVRLNDGESLSITGLKKPVPPKKPA